MNSPETVEINSNDIESTSLYTKTTVDSLYERQKREVAQMRSSLISCNENDIRSIKSAMNNVLALRVMHQIARIVRFTEMLDKIEDKLYRSLDATLLQADELDPTTWAMLMKVQAQLQETMIESQKLLDAGFKNYQLVIEVPQTVIDDQHSINEVMYDAEQRERIRQSAQAVLEILSSNPLTGEPIPKQSTIDNSSETIQIEESEKTDDENPDQIDAKELARKAIQNINNV